MLRTERQRQNLSVRKLADTVSAGGVTTVSGQMISILEQGRKPPSWKLAWALTQVLNIDDKKKTAMLKATHRARMMSWKLREADSLQKYLSEL
jgi:transcriptional regulator with XRE-family HTH domain